MWDRAEWRRLVVDVLSPSIVILIVQLFTHFGSRSETSSQSFNLLIMSFGPVIQIFIVNLCL